MSSTCRRCRTRTNASKLLTDNGEAFTDRFCAFGQRQPTGTHAFGRVCADNQIEHRLIKPRTPQTNGMIERFDGCIADVVRTHRFDSSASLKGTLKNSRCLCRTRKPRYVRVRNSMIIKAFEKRDL